LAAPRGRQEWTQLADEVLYRLIAAEGAVIWAEAEAKLSETSWVHDNFDSTVPANQGPQPHHLTAARRRLELQDLIQERPAILNKRRVSAWVTTAASQERRTTETDRTAATKRRLYRTYLAWTGNSQLCGSIAEQVVHHSLEDLKGTHLWIPPSARPGRITELRGRPISVGGPLDAAGFWPLDPHDPSRGLVPFAVEVKNIRSWIYPWVHEVWDLLSKVADFPDVVPVLVARKIHLITFRFFKDIGALGFQMGCQWFAAHGTTKAPLDPSTFEEVTSRLGFLDARRAADPPAMHPPLRNWFRDVPTKVDHTLVLDQQERWERAAPIVANYDVLRDETVTGRARHDAWADFAQAIDAAGLSDLGGWVSHDF
jgi:hypothetical protein